MSLAFVRGIHRLPVNSPYKGPEMRKMYPVDDIMQMGWLLEKSLHAHVWCPEEAMLLLIITEAADWRGCSHPQQLGVAKNST